MGYKIPTAVNYLSWARLGTEIAPRRPFYRRLVIDGDTVLNYRGPRQELEPTLGTHRPEMRLYCLLGSAGGVGRRGYEVGIGGEDVGGMEIRRQRIGGNNRRTLDRR